MRGIVAIGMIPTLLQSAVHAGIAGRGAGTGRVGAGTVGTPLDGFTAALEALARTRGVV